MVNKNQEPTKVPRDICESASIAVNSTAWAYEWVGRTPLPARYFGTAIEEREAHWPKGQVMAKWCGHTTVSPVDVCDVELSGSY